MKLPALKPSMRTVLVLAVVAGILFCAGVFTYVVGTSHLRAASLDLESKQKQVVDNKKIAQGLTEIQARYLETQDQIGCLETCVATHAYVPTLLKQLEALGTQMNVKMLAVRPIKAEAAPPPIKRTSEDPGASGSKSANGNGTPEVKEAPKPYDELKIDIELEGTYWHAHNFIYRLTTFPKIIAVNQVNLAPVSVVEGEGVPKLVVKLNVTAFIFHEDNKQQKSPDGQAPGAPESTSSASQGSDEIRAMSDEGDSLSFLIPHSSFLTPDRRPRNEG